MKGRKALYCMAASSNLQSINNSKATVINNFFLFCRLREILIPHTAGSRLRSREHASLFRLLAQHAPKKSTKNAAIRPFQALMSLVACRCMSRRSITNHIHWTHSKIDLVCRPSSPSTSSYHLPPGINSLRDSILD